MDINNKKYKIDFNNKKEIIINNKIITVYRIVALTNFADIEIGDIGGYVSGYHNLSQYGDCWIYHDAIVCECGKVYDNAIVRDNVMIYGYAKIQDNTNIMDNVRVFENANILKNALIADKAQIFGDACIGDNACVGEYSKVHGNARILNNSRICDNAQVYNCATVIGDAVIRHNAIVKDNAYVSGVAVLRHNAILSQQQRVVEGVVDVDLSKNIKESIRCQTGLGVFDNKVIAYKQVNKDLTSFYDKNFVYKIGEIAEEEFCDYSNDSCSAGLHFSNMNYWNKHTDLMNSTFLIAEINLEDIITVQEGKIRCKKAKILGKYDIQC